MSADNEKYCYAGFSLEKCNMQYPRINISSDFIVLVGGCLLLGQKIESRHDTIGSQNLWAEASRHGEQLIQRFAAV